ncbi:MAG: hypothetical protein ACI81R_001250, partial [Bradymonadia bacterium]
RPDDAIDELARRRVLLVEGAMEGVEVHITEVREGLTAVAVALGTL